MVTLAVRLFGKFSAASPNHIVEGLESRKAQELFCYLLLHRDRPHPREALASLLWSNTTTAQSKSYLRKALWQLQGALARIGASVEGLLTVEHEWVQISVGEALWLDVAAFEASLAGLMGVPGEAIDEGRAAWLSAAAELYRGELLDGWYQDWCLFERERLQDLYLALLDKLMGYCEVNRLVERGLAYGAEILRYDRAREQTHRGLMRLHVLAGDRTGALRQYERCRAVLDRELQVEPTAYTVELYEQIRASGPGAPPAPAAPAHPPQLASLLERLRETRRCLDEAQRRLDDDIQLLEQALGEPRAPGARRRDK